MFNRSRRALQGQVTGRLQCARRRYQAKVGRLTPTRALVLVVGGGALSLMMSRFTAPQRYILATDHPAHELRMCPARLAECARGPASAPLLLIFPAITSRVPAVARRYPGWRKIHRRESAIRMLRLNQCAIGCQGGLRPGPDTAPATQHLSPDDFILFSIQTMSWSGRLAARRSGRRPRLSVSASLLTSAFVHQGSGTCLGSLLMPGQGALTSAGDDGLAPPGRCS